MNTENKLLLLFDGWESIKEKDGEIKASKTIENITFEVRIDMLGVTVKCSKFDVFTRILQTHIVSSNGKPTRLETIQKLEKLALNSIF